MCETVELLNRFAFICSGQARITVYLGRLTSQLKNTEERRRKYYTKVLYVQECRVCLKSQLHFRLRCGFEDRRGLCIDMKELGIIAELI